jgi:integrase
MVYLARKGCKATTVATTNVRLRGMLSSVARRPMSAVSPVLATKLYDAYAEHHSPDTHRNTLSQARTFGKWLVKRGWLQANPWVDVEAYGKRSRGKTQLTIDQARQFAALTLERAQADDLAALAALCALLLAMRAGEIVGLEAEDINDEGRLVYIRAAKTEAGVRVLGAPPVLATLLAKQARSTDGRLFPFRREWVREAVLRLCRDAGVPEVCAHSLRGLHATLAVKAGLSPHAVAGVLGHASPEVTRRHYIAPGTEEQVRLLSAVEVFRGRSADGSEPTEGEPN